MKNAMEIKLAGRSPLGRLGDLVRLEPDGRVYLNGRRIELSLTPSDVHDPTELPTYLAGYRQWRFRADEASKVVLVDHDKDKFRSFSSDDTFRRVNVKGSIEGAIPEVDPNTSLTSYAVVDRFVGSFINTITEQNATGLYKPRQAAMRRCSRVIGMDREIDVATLLSTSGNWNANNVIALGATQKWNGGTASDPVVDIQTLGEITAEEITDHWMNRRVGNAFLRHPSVRDQMRQMIGDNAAPATLAMVNAAPKDSVVDFAIPGLGLFHIVNAKVKNETTGNLDFIWPDSLIATTSPPGVPEDGEEIATSYTFRRRGAAAVGYETREFRVEGRGPKGGTMVVVAMADIAIMTGSNCGGLITGAYQ